MDTIEITVAEAMSFRGALSSMAQNVSQDQLAQSAAFECAAQIIGRAIADQHPGVNYGVLVGNTKHSDVVAIDATAAMAGAAACRSLRNKDDGDEWPAVARILGY